jgi:hypothetical protein
MCHCRLPELVAVLAGESAEAPADRRPDIDDSTTPSGESPAGELLEESLR